MTHEHLDETLDPRDRAIDDALGQALRAEDPGAAFTQRVLARAREERAARKSSEVSRLSSEVSDKLPSEVSDSQSPEVSTPTPPRVPTGFRSDRKRFIATRKLIAAIAASLTLAAVGTQQWMQHRRYVAEGERARAQVLAALRLTNETLNTVHDKITEREQAR
jgi:hypothetical protein